MAFAAQLASGHDCTRSIFAHIRLGIACKKKWIIKNNLREIVARNIV
jgi:hypothetical protein